MNLNYAMIHFLFVMLLIASCNSSSPNKPETPESTSDSKGSDQPTESRLASIKLPPGFKIEEYALDVPGARSMDISPGGVLYVGSRSQGNVYALKDENGDHKAEKKWTIANGLTQPNGIAFKDGTLFVAEISRILKFPDIDKNLEKPRHEVFLDNYPSKEHHGWRYIGFGPDNKLYVAVGAPCNICEPDDDIFATITRIDIVSKNREIVQRGIRNSVGFTWHPVTNELWFTDNGGDWLGEDMPACELNYAPTDGMNFGYPYCHQGDYPDPKLGKKHACSEFTPPAQKLGAHVAPLGIEFYTGTMFPEMYRNQIFIAEHGSWNRTVPQGYRIMLVKMDGNKPVSYEVFAEGWLESGKAWGRPVDIELLPDGSMLLSDDAANTIYRISYSGK